MTLSIAHELMLTFVGITWIRWPFVVLVLQKPQAGQKLPALRTSLQQTLRRSIVKTWNQHASTKQTNVHSSHTIFECVCINNLSVFVSPLFLHFRFASRLRYLQFVVFWQALMKRLQNSPVDLVAKLGAALCQITWVALGGNATE